MPESEENPKRRGLLSSLLELFGEEDAEDFEGREREAAATRDAETPTREPEAARRLAASDLVSGPAAVHADEPLVAQPEAPTRAAAAEPTDDFDIVVPDPDVTPEVRVPSEPAASSLPDPEPEVAPAAVPPAPQPADASEVMTDPVPADRRLGSPVVGQRLAALDQLAREGLPGELVDHVERLLVDPEVEVRVKALTALLQRPERVSAERLSGALRDPTDEVRAAAMRLAAARGVTSIDHLAPALGQRRWPKAQEVALAQLPALIESAGLDDVQLHLLLASVGRLDSPPSGAERSGFARIARVVGTDRLAESLALPDARRAGAAWLLLEEGSPEALNATATLAEDDLAACRTAASLARNQLQGAHHDEAAPAARAEPAPAPPRPRTPLDERTSDLAVSGLARALDDPEERVRSNAAAALAQASRDVVVEWCGSCLRSGSLEDARLAARAAEALALRELAGLLLDRGAATQGDGRDVFVAALQSMNLTADDITGLVDGVDASRRGEAIRLAWDVAGIRGLGPLKSFLSDSAGPVRMAVLELLGEAGDPDISSLAMRVLGEDSSPAVRATAVKVLARTEVRTRLRALDHVLDTEPDPDVRATAVEALVPGIGPAGSEALVRALHDADERVWRTAVEHFAALAAYDAQTLWSVLERCGENQRRELLAIVDERGAEPLSGIALEKFESPEANDRLLAAELAARAGTPECVRRLIAALMDPVPDVRRLAAGSLSALRTPEAVPALGRALNDPEPDVRIESVRALGMIDDDAVITPLIGVLRDPDVRVHEEAHKILARWSSPSLARRLVEALAIREVEASAAELLRKLGPGAVEPLVAALVDGSTELIDSAGRLLSELVGSDSFTRRLTSLSTDDRARAVAALGAIGDDTAVAGLIQALSDPEPDVRVRALRHLARIGDASALEAVRRTFLRDPVHEVVSAAEEALGRLQSPPES